MLRDGLSPYAEQDIRSLSVDQPYDISLRLVVPATEQNYALGNFMASLTLRTPRNATVLSARRPVSSLFRSDLSMPILPLYMRCSYMSLLHSCLQSLADRGIVSSILSWQSH